MLSLGGSRDLWQISASFTPIGPEHKRKAVQYNLVSAPREKMITNRSRPVIIQ